jgi:hypothetical protein
VVCADQPLLQVADGAIRQGNDGRDATPELTPARLLSGHMSDAGRGQSVETLVRVGVDRRTRRDVRLDEGLDRRLFEVRKGCRTRPDA